MVILDFIYVFDVILLLNLEIPMPFLHQLKRSKPIAPQGTAVVSTSAPNRGDGIYS